MSLWFFVLAFVAGVAVPVQTAINTRLRLDLDSSASAATLISFATGAVLLLVIAAFQPGGLRLAASAFQQSPWKLLGGPIGVAFVFCMTVLAPKIGIAALISLVIAGQVVSSIGFDHFGLFGLAQKQITWERAVGALLMIAGVLMVNWSQISASLAKQH